LTCILNTIIPKYFKIYFKYSWSCICILHFCKGEILFQNTFQVKLCSMLHTKCYQINFFTVLISARFFSTYEYLVTTTLQRDRLSYSCAVNGVTIECLQYLAEPCVNDLSGAQ